jgi:uncharacterized Ntn-hydrolase superfamily protein
MTFSIIARDSNSDAFGVAVSTAVPCVGAMVPWAKAGVGAIATQSFTNVELGREGLKLFEAGLSPRAALEGMLAEDPNAPLRQVAGIDAKGRMFAHTGAGCVAWCGSREGDGYSVQGNMLVGQATIDAMAAAFEATAGTWLGIRLMAALEAGQAAGGDNRGRVSAALLVTPMDAVAGPPPPAFDPRRIELNIRVDEHPDPVAELRRIFDLMLRMGREQR